MLLLVPLGLATKWYQGILANWVNHSLGGVIYVVFWILFFAFLFPRAKYWKVPAWVFVITSALETLQLWHPPFLQSIRATFLGHALLGNSFSWWDFLHYFLGTVLGLLYLNYLQQRR
jgi:hypothetical protein